MEPVAVASGSCESYPTFLAGPILVAAVFGPSGPDVMDHDDQDQLPSSVRAKQLKPKGTFRSSGAD